MDGKAVNPMDPQAPTLASPADFAAVWALWRACAADARSLWNDEYPTEAFLRDDIENARLYAFRRDGELVGTATLMETDDLEEQGFPFCQKERTAVLTRLCVRPSLQGRGLGGALLRQMENPALRKGACAIHLLCDVRNVPALSMYRREGYREVCRAALYGEHFSVQEKLLSEEKPF
jgi:ribosomal protein S18 acetylase RimI-like enzyme